MKTAANLCLKITILFLLLGSFAQAENEIAKKKKYRGYLGVSLEEVSTNENVELGLEQGQAFKISAVLPNLPAEKAGFNNGDVILSVNGKVPKSIPDLVRHLQSLGADAIIEVLILRNKEKKNIIATLAPHPQDLLEEPDTSPGYLRVKIIKDIQYYTKEGQDSDKHKLNLILPITEERFPLMMWIHGGAWSFGSRSFETALGVRFAERGIGFVAIDYRLSPGLWRGNKFHKDGISHPEHVKDCARAFKWLRTNAVSYGCDPNYIFVGGFSSGAHLATLLTLDTTYLEELGISPDAIKAVVSIGGAYDLVKYHKILVTNSKKGLADAHLKAVFGPEPELWRKASPTTYSKNCRVPMLVVAENNEPIRQYMEDFKHSMSKANINSIKYLVAEDRNRSQSISMMSRKGEDHIRDAAIEFIQNYCKNMK